MKRRLLLLLVAILGSALLAPAVSEASPTAAAARFGNVTNRFFNGSTMLLPERGQASLYPSIMRVSGFRQGRLIDVNLTLHSYAHTFPTMSTCCWWRQEGETPSC